jgi:hypothetical protein
MTVIELFGILSISVGFKERMAGSLQEVILPAKICTTVSRSRTRNSSSPRVSRCAATATLVTTTGNENKKGS